MLRTRLVPPRFHALIAGGGGAVDTTVEPPTTASLLVFDAASLTSVQAAGYSNARQLVGGGSGVQQGLLVIGGGTGGCYLGLPNRRVTNRSGVYVIAGSTTTVFDFVVATNTLALTLPPVDATWNRHRVRVFAALGTTTIGVPSGSYLNGVLNGTLSVTVGQFCICFPDPNASTPTWRARAF